MRREVSSIESETATFPTPGPAGGSPVSIPENPHVPVEVWRSRSGDVWLLVIRKCPVCHGTHTHGGGRTTGAPSGGHRLSHCWPHETGSGYYLDVPANWPEVAKDAPEERPRRRPALRRSRPAARTTLQPTRRP